MRTKWLIQSTGFASSYLEEVVNTLNDQKIAWDDFGIVQDTITNLENILDTQTDIYIIRGGTKVLSLLNTNSLQALNPHLSDNQIIKEKEYLEKLKNAIDYNEEKFDMEYYKDLSLPFLNDDCEIDKVKNLLYYEFQEDNFIKPSKDSKAFNGGIIYAGETLMNYLMRTPHRNIESIETQSVIISPIKKIKDEYRFFMYKNEILGCSRYMLNGKVNPDSFVPDNIKKAAEYFGLQYNPAEIYVIDLCTFEDTDEIKIVEYNCWNCSGFYHCDIRNIINKINQIKS